MVSARRLPAFFGCLAIAMAGCSSVPAQVADGFGSDPALPEPTDRLIPTVNIAVAEPWAAGESPEPAEGLAVTEFARDLDHPRWLYELPNGDVLVAESNAPPRPEDGKGVKGLVMRFVMKRAGAGVPSANRITLLRDGDGDGVAETRSAFLEGLSLSWPDASSPALASPIHSSIER